MASKNTLQREKLAFRYSSALEAGDFETITSILGVAVHDGILAQMLREIDEVYAHELEQSRPSHSQSQARVPRRPIRPIYWLALAATITLIFVAVIKLRSDNHHTGVSSEYLTLTVPASTSTPSPTLTLTTSPTIQPSITPRPTRQWTALPTDQPSVTPQPMQEPVESAATQPPMPEQTDVPSDAPVMPSPTDDHIPAIPDIVIPTVQIPPVNIPDIEIPAIDIQIPPVNIPGVEVPTDIHIPAVTIPGIVIPTLDIQFPNSPHAQQP